MCNEDIDNKLNPINAIKYKILVIDDDVIIRKTTIKLVRSIIQNSNNNYQIIEGSDGKDIIDLVHHDRDNLIKLILTDENMTYMLGSEAIYLVKLMIDIPIVSITAMDDEEGLSKIYKSGADIVLSKPVSKRQLEEVILSLKM